MNKIEVHLDTESDVRAFVGIASTISEPVFLEDGTHYRANGKSMMGVLYGSLEFKHLYVLSENQYLETKFSKFLI